jgi:CBS domain-containing protein
VRTPVGAWHLSAEKEEIDMAWIHPDARYYYDWGEVPSARSGRAPIRRTDTSIKAAAIDLLRVNPYTKDDELKVEVKRGVVIVQGVVRSRLAKQAVGDECWDIAGVTDVSNQVEVAEEPAPEISIMTTEVVALDASSSLRTAAEVMRDQDVGSVVVTDGGQVSGIITRRRDPGSLLADVTASPSD